MDVYLVDVPDKNQYSFIMTTKLYIAQKHKKKEK